ncbi:MAG: type II toxin-antitoxin system VapC family toxin [Trueperaceae bacterium]|nr:type II toxin-antitoxin system VapC family toxin [Trueperaceae bacterium]
MKVLLDTHALLWWVTDDPRLSDPARDAIVTADVAVSVVSLWEIEIKRGLGRIDVDPRALIREVSQTKGFRMLEIRATHVLTLGELPLLHKDPFDRMLIAQAIRDRLTLVSCDEAIHRYQVDVAW